MRARTRIGFVVAACGLLVALLAPARAEPVPLEAISPRAAATLDLVRQTPIARSGGSFQMWVDTGTTPADGSLELVVHGRIRSRSELATSIDGIGLRSSVYRITLPIAELAVERDGSRRLVLSLDPARPDGLDLRQAGAYPIELIARDSVGAEVGSLISHLLVAPAAGDESPPLSVAVVVGGGGTPALAPDGSTAGLAQAIRGLPELATAVAAGGAPVTWAVSPATIEALQGSRAAPDKALLDALATAAEGDSVTAVPYAPTSPDALLEAGLGDELEEQVTRGRSVMTSALDVTPADVWVAGDDLTSDGVALLADAGVEHVVVAADQVEALRPGLLSLSLAHPFVIGADEGQGLDAMALDPAVLDRLGTTASPGLEASRLLAELAMIWFEQPGIPRGAVVPIGPSVRPAVVTALLEGLDTGQVLRAVPIDTVFDEARPLLQPGGRQVERPLVAEPPHAISRVVRDQLAEVRAALPSVRATLGPTSATASQMEAHLLLSTSSALREDVQAAHLRTARTLVDGVVDDISAPERETITLTARSGTIPLTLRNDTGAPVSVVVHLRSPKLEFPKGPVIPLVLTDEVTRLDIAVRVRASGAFPLEVQITSPDGRLSLASVDYSIRSTAVSGVGVVLSAGAALFLLVWWGRHWRRTRRSTKLVSSAHPALREPDEPSPSN